MNIGGEILSIFSLLRVHPPFDKKTTTMNRLRKKIANKVDVWLLMLLLLF